MKPTCVEDTFGTRQEYIHLDSSSPVLGSGVTIAEYKFELMTGLKY